MPLAKPTFPQLLVVKYHIKTKPDYILNVKHDFVLSVRVFSVVVVDWHGAMALI